MGWPAKSMPGLSPESGGGKGVLDLDEATHRVEGRLAFPVLDLEHEVRPVVVLMDGVEAAGVPVNFHALLVVERA